MGLRLEDLIRGGALAQLCGRFQSLGAQDHHWQQVRLFALREFREADAITIDRLIAAAKQARCAADAINRGGKHCTLPECDIPGIES